MKNNENYVTGLEKKVAELEEENQRLHDIIIKAPIPLFVVGKDHRITHFNEALEELSGIPAQDMIGTKNHWKAFYSSERPVMADLIIEQASDAQIVSHYGLKYDPPSKDKKKFSATDFFKDIGEKGKWLFFTASAFHDKEGNIAGAVETLQDVTEEKIAERKNKSIMKISAALPEYPELEDLMNYISKETKELLNVEGAVVLLLDEIKEELFFTGVSYDDSDTERRAKQVRFPLDSILAGEIIKSGKYALINDAEKLTREYPERDEKLGYKTKSLLEFPIKSDSRIIGVLCAINKKQNLFDENDLELIAMIAGTCAISIENARFSEAVREAYRDVASLNRAKGKAINHLSHELKTPVAILTGSLQILRKKLESLPEAKVDATLSRLERNLDRIIDIQDEVADIMEEKTYSAREQLLKMFETCRDMLETLIQQNQGAENFEDSIRLMIEEKFGPREIHYTTIHFSEYFKNLYTRLTPQFSFRNIDIQIKIDKDLPPLLLPEEILDKMICGLIKNGIENTPDMGKIHIFLKKMDGGVLFGIQDFGVGIEIDAQKRIFEGFFTTQKASSYSTKSPFAFNAGGKGADLLRMKIFSDRHGFVLNMESKRCTFLLEDPDNVCVGNSLECPFCRTKKDCLDSGYSFFSVFFPPEKTKSL